MISIVFFSIFGYVQVLQVEQKVTQRSNSDMCLTWKSLCPTPTPCAATFVMINSGCRKLFQHVWILWWWLVGFNIAPLQFGQNLRSTQELPSEPMRYSEWPWDSWAAICFHCDPIWFLYVSITVTYPLWYSMVIESRPFMHEFPMTFI